MGHCVAGMGLDPFQKSYDRISIIFLQQTSARFRDDLTMHHLHIQTKRTLPTDPFAT